MSNTYDTHDLTMLRASLELAHDASLAEIAEEARRIRLDLIEADGLTRIMEEAVGIDALGLHGHERLPDVMRRIERLRDAERIAGERLSLLQQIARALSPDHHPSSEKLLDLARDAAQAVLDGDRNGVRWGIATQTLASLRAPIDHLRVAARLDEALTDLEVIEHAAAALERWREAAEARREGHSMADVLNSLPAVPGHTWSVTARGRVVRLRDASGALVATARRHDSGWWPLTIGDRAVGDFARLDDLAAAVAAEMARRPTDLPPMVVGWRPVGAHRHALVRVEGDDETMLFEARGVRPADGRWVWQVYPRAHHDGHAGMLPPLTLVNLGDAKAMILAFVRAANPDRRVELEAPCAP